MPVTDDIRYLPLPRLTIFRIVGMSKSTRRQGIRHEHLGECVATTPGGSAAPRADRLRR
jgi:hypothetical protein